MSKPSIPKGTRDFSPQQMRQRNYIFEIIRETYHRFGFEQIETPSMENLSTLEGKYGDEGDKLLFRILNSGNVIEDIRNAGSNLTISDLTEKGLRYDLTVPFARYVVMHQNEITFPFRRYQVQPVWRADRPQKGRYREFFQCDADIIGSNSLLNELDLLSGKKYVSASLTEKLAETFGEKQDHEQLSDREMQVLQLIASGKAVSEIATEISLSVNTISTYRMRILEKLKLNNNSELTRYALDNKLI